MRFPTDVPVKLVMLGTGGTGGHAAPTSTGCCTH